MIELMSCNEILSRLNSRKYECYYPRAMQREFWDNIPSEQKAQLIVQGEKAQAQKIPLLELKDYMKFFRNGDRLSYETPFFARRQMLTKLTLAECAEYKGRFLDDIAEVIWQILSEPVWTLPAHQRLTDYPLPGPEEWMVALFSAETARILTDVLQFLQPELEKEFLPLVNRIKYEVNHRVLEVCERETFWWYERYNNWTVWCCYSIISAAITLWQSEPERLAKFIDKHIIAMKNFYDSYPEDGGCDEGAAYWMVAAGMLLNGLDILQFRLGGFDSWLAETKLKRMVEFIPRVNLCGKWFMGFSDAESFFPKFPRGLFLKYAAMVGSTTAAQLALELPEDQNNASGNRNIGGFLETISEFTADFSPRGNFKRNAVDFWEDLQIWIARQNPGNAEKGMICTLKGGHNRQSHNHNDLGHFSLWYNNVPVIVDVGRTAYDKTCFSNRRYTLWNLNATGHNAAYFDNHDQGFGAQYKAELTPENNRIICDLSGAFEADNGISHYSRKVDAQWENNRIIISEKAEFEGRKNLTINFYTPIAPEKISSNKLHIGDVELSFSGIEFIHAEKSEKLDAKLTGLWGALWEIRLGKTAENHAEWLIEFTGR